MAFTGSRRLRARLSTYLFNGHKTGIRLIHSPSNLPHPPAIVSLAPEHEKEACTWLSSFRAAATVPKHLNVNKLSTKVTARCRVDAPWIPLWVRNRLMRSSYYVKSTHSILMTSSTSRSQAANVDDVLAKLHTLVAESAASLIVKSPTREQRKRVASFQKMDDARRRLQKDKRSVAKRSRSNQDWD